MKFSRQLVISSLAVVVLSACSGSPEQRRQAKDNFDYLDDASSVPWVVPDGAVREFYPNYDIPAGNFTGPVGREVDIRPPQQILKLIPGARFDTKGEVVTLWLLRKEEADNVWQTARDMVDERDIRLVQNSEQRMETAWITWESEDEENTLGARYLFEKLTANNRFGLSISLIDWRENGVVKAISRTNKERYNTFMTNMVTSAYDQKLRAEAERKALQLVKRIPVSMGKDRSGLPVIIARSQYNVFWQRISKVLPVIGFTLEERNQSQGIIEAKYASPDDEFWQQIGTEPMALTGRSYTFLLGDLGNRTSINITDSSGKPVSEEVLKSVMPVLATMVERED